MSLVMPARSIFRPGVTAAINVAPIAMSWLLQDVWHLCVRLKKEQDREQSRLALLPVRTTRLALRVECEAKRRRPWARPGAPSAVAGVPTGASRTRLHRPRLDELHHYGSLCQVLDCFG